LPRIAKPGAELCHVLVITKQGHYEHDMGSRAS
jgi:hypothetical protein